MGKPARGKVKCNVDATIFKDEGCYGVNMCLRDENGHFIAAKTTWSHNLAQPQEAEARGLKEAIIWLDYRGLTEVSTKLDCKQVVDDISNNIGINSKLGAILNSCKALLFFFSSKL
jgi:ribonuclease HI